MEIITVILLVLLALGLIAVVASWVTVFRHINKARRQITARHETFNTFNRF
jgi:FlaG/FlaF family flagellin (archaellin)